MECRLHCGACCIAPSISSNIPGMPNGKSSGIPCIHLAEDYSCKIIGSADRPDVCAKFLPEEVICGSNREEAIDNLYKLENWLD